MFNISSKDSVLPLESGHVQMSPCKPVPFSHVLTGLYSSMRSSCSGVHLSSTGSRISNGTPPVSYSTGEETPALQHESDQSSLRKKVDLLTVNVVLQGADALLVQTHHRREEDGLGARVYLHLPVKSLPSKYGRFLGAVPEI